MDMDGRITCILVLNGIGHGGGKDGMDIGPRHKTGLSRSAGINMGGSSLGIAHTLVNIILILLVLLSFATLIWLLAFWFHDRCKLNSKSQGRSH